VSESVAWFRTVSAVLLLLMACAVSSAAQSSRGTLTVSLQVVPSTALEFGKDGKAQIIEANGTNGLAITTIDTPVKVDKAFNVGVTRTNASTATMSQTQQTTVSNRSEAGKESFITGFRTASDRQFHKLMIKIGRKIKSNHPPDELAGPEMNSSGPADQTVAVQ
jgi:hypothetical protein